MVLEVQQGILADNQPVLMTTQAEQPVTNPLIWVEMQQSEQVELVSQSSRPSKETNVDFLLIACSEHRKHEHERGTGVGSTIGTTGGQPTGAYDNRGTGFGGTTGNVGGQSTGAYDNASGTTGHQSSHLGRNTAIGAGGVGLGVQ